MWRIDKESEHNLESRVGHSERHSRISYAEAAMGMQSEDLPTLRDDGETELPMVKFRTLDDDGNVEYEGMLHDDDECLNQEAALVCDARRRLHNH